MNNLIFHNGKDPAFSIWKQEFDGCHEISKAMKAAGWTVVWFIHAQGETYPMNGYEIACKEYKEMVE